MAKVGYIRVSTETQDVSLQLQGIELEKRFIDVASGKDPKRPQLDSLLEYTREGDIVYVQAIDRMARNLIDLRNILNILTKRGARVEFLRENLVITGDENSTSKLLLNLLGTFAEFERNIMLERQREGIARAKANGKYSGSKNKLSLEKMIKLKNSLDQGVPKARAARDFGIHRETVYQYLKMWAENPLVDTVVNV